MLWIRRRINVNYMKCTTQLRRRREFKVFRDFCFPPQTSRSKSKKTLLTHSFVGCELLLEYLHVLMSFQSIPWRKQQARMLVLGEKLFLKLHMSFSRVDYNVAHKIIISLCVNLTIEKNAAEFFCDENKTLTKPQERIKSN